MSADYKAPPSLFTGLPPEVGSDVPAQPNLTTIVNPAAKGVALARALLISSLPNWNPTAEEIARAN